MIFSKGLQASRPKLHPPFFGCSPLHSPGNTIYDKFNSKSWHSSSFMAIHKPFWAESKAKIVSRLDHSGYYLNIEEVVHHLLVQDPRLQNLTSIYSLPAPQYLNINIKNLTSIYSLPAPPPRVDLKKVWLCCCRCCLKFRNQSFHSNLW